MARWLLAAGVVLGVVVAGWLAFVWWVQPGEPSSFYDPPAGLPSSPGSLVRQEPVDPPAGGQRAWRVLSTSTGEDGRPVAVSGVVVAPDGEPPAGGWPVVAWAHGTTGVDRRCAPSMEEGGALDRVPELADLVAAGNVVTVTDYPGLGTPGPHPYLVGESEGRAVLDSVRAARSLLGDGAVAARTVLYGHSQGGHAVVFANELAPAYAPDVEVVGVAAMAPPTDLGVLLRDDAKEAAGVVLTALALSSWSSLYPDTELAAVVEPLARPLVRDLGRKCIATTAEGLSGLPEVAALSETFLSTDPTTAPGWSQRLAANSPGDLPRDVPLLVSQGLADTLVRPAVTQAYVEAQCAAGATIELDTYAGVDHFGVRTVAAPTVRDWLLARLRAQPVEPGCRVGDQPGS